MKTALIIHGIGGHAGIHWQQWLHDELKAQGYAVLMPDLPDSDRPDRKTWLREITGVLKDIDLSKLMIVAHSLGATTALDFLEQAGSGIDTLICVSGFAKDYGAELNSYFLGERTIDFEKVKSNLGRATVIYGDDDPYVPQDALRYVADSLDVEPVVIPKGGHLNTEAGFIEFPKLLGLV